MTNAVIRIVFVLSKSNGRYRLKCNSSFKLTNVTAVRKEKVDCDSASVHFYRGPAEATLICHAKIQIVDFSIRRELSGLVYQSIRYVYCFERLFGEKDDFG